METCILVSHFGSLAGECAEMSRLVLCVLCVVLATSTVQGCGFLDIKCRAEQDIAAASAKLKGDAKIAFEQAMNYLTTNDIDPLADKVQAAIDAGIDKVEKDVNDTIDHFMSTLDQVIEHAAQQATALAANITHAAEVIINQTAAATAAIEKTLYHDANNLLEQINQIVQKGKCAEASGAKEIKNDIYKVIKVADPNYRFSSCWRDLGHKITTSLEDLSDIDLYNFQKTCTLLSKITPTTPIKGPGGIIDTYAQGQKSATDYFCIGETSPAPAFQDTMTKEWIWWGVQVNLWNSTLSSGKPLARAVGDDPSCGTPVECYAQAIEILKEAEQKIMSLNLAVSTLNDTVKALTANQSQTNAAVAAVKATATANTQASATNANAITINKNNITVNTNSIGANIKRFSMLKVNPCNCTVNQNQKDICDYPKETFLNGLVPGTSCCDLCITTGDGAKAYAWPRLLPGTRAKKSKSRFV